MHAVLKPRTNEHRLELATAIARQNHCFSQRFGTRRFEALHIAVLVDGPMSLQLLLGHQANEHALDGHGGTAMHVAAARHDFQQITQLEPAGADPFPLDWVDESDSLAALLDACWKRLYLILINFEVLCQYTTGDSRPNLRCACNRFNWQIDARMGGEDVLGASCTDRDQLGSCVARTEWDVCTCDSVPRQRDMVGPDVDASGVSDEMLVPSPPWMQLIGRCMFPAVSPES